MRSRARAAHSPFLELQLERFPAGRRALEAARWRRRSPRPRAPGEDAADLAAALRRERSALAAALAIGDLAGAVPLERLTAALSDLADRALERALAAAIAERTPGEAPRGFAVVALGKHGSRELNYSSDIDLLFLSIPRPCRSGRARSRGRRR